MFREAKLAEETAPRFPGDTGRFTALCRGSIYTYIYCGVVLGVGDGLLGQLNIGDDIAGESTGLKDPGLVVLIVLSLVNGLGAVGGYLIDEGIRSA